MVMECLFEYINIYIYIFCCVTMHLLAHFMILGILIVIGIFIKHRIYDTKDILLCEGKKLLWKTCCNLIPSENMKNYVQYVKVTAQFDWYFLVFILILLLK